MPSTPSSIYTVQNMVLVSVIIACIIFIIAMFVMKREKYVPVNTEMDVNDIISRYKYVEKYFTSENQHLKNIINKLKSDSERIMVELEIVKALLVTENGYTGSTGGYVTGMSEKLNTFIANRDASMEQLLIVEDLLGKVINDAHDSVVQADNDNLKPVYSDPESKIIAPTYVDNNFTSSKMAEVAQDTRNMQRLITGSNVESNTLAQGTGRDME